MNRPSNILLSIWVLLLVPPASIIACPEEDCGPCDYWNGWECAPLCTGCCECDWYYNCGNFDLYCDFGYYCSGCECQPSSSCTISSVTHSRFYCWEGEQITFQAYGNGFPPGQVTWTASAGSFPYGNTGTSVTWQAPGGTGGYATITATCESSSKSDTVSYGFVSIGGYGGDLLRSQSDVFYATVEPADFPVSFAQDSSTSPHLSVNPLWGFALEVDNLILASDAHAYVDTALASIQAAAPGVGIRIFGRTYWLKKWLGDVAESKIIPDAQDIYDMMESVAESQGGNAAYDTFTSDGFNSLVAGSARDDVRTAISQGFSTVYPFPASVTNSIINESRTYSVSYQFSLQTAGLSFTLFPNLEPPDDLGAWIRSANQYGLTGMVTDIQHGALLKLNVTAAGSTWSVPFSMSLDFSNNWGKCTFSFSIAPNIYIE